MGFGGIVGYSTVQYGIVGTGETSRLAIAAMQPLYWEEGKGC